MEFDISEDRFEEILREELRKEIRNRIEFDKDSLGRYQYICNDKLSANRITDTLKTMLIEIHGEAINSYIKKLLNSDDLQKEVISYISEKLKNTFED